MNSRQLKAFICVAECGSFSKAENILYLSKQAIIKQINLLEEEVGVPLILRNAQGVTLTSAGKVFLDGAKNLNHMMDKVICETKGSAAFNKLYLVLAQSYEDSPLMNITNRFTEAYPDIPIEYISADFGQYLEYIRKGSLSICTYPYRPEIETLGLKYTHLYYDDLWCLMAPSHPLTQKKKILPDDLIGQKIYVGDEYWAGRLVDHYRDYMKLEVEVISSTIPSYMAVCRECGICIGNKWKKDHTSLFVSRPFQTDLLLSSGIVTAKYPSLEVNLFLEVAEAYRKDTAVTRQ